MKSIDLLLMSVSERALLYDVVSEYYLKLMWLTLFFYVLELLVYIVSFEFFKTKGAPCQKYTTQIKKLTRGAMILGAVICLAFFLFSAINGPTVGCPPWPMISVISLPAFLLLPDLWEIRQKEKRL